MRQTSTVRASGDVAAERVWTLLAAPGCWPAWAPHMRHVSAIGSSDAPGWVEEGQELAIHTVVPKVSIPVVVTEVEEGRSWRMEAHLPFGTMTSAHTVTPGSASTLVTVSLSWDGPRVLGKALLRSYEPIARYALERLIALAAGEQAGALEALRRLCSTDT